MRLGAAGGMPNGSRSPWTTSVGTVTASSSSSRRLLRPARRVHREREAEHRLGAGRGRGPAGDAGARGAAAGDQRHLEGELLDHARPGRVELVRRRGRAPARDAVGLLDERDGQAGLERRVRRALQVRRLDAAAGPVPEHERGARRVDLAQVHPRLAVWRLQQPHRPDNAAQ